MLRHTIYVSLFLIACFGLVSCTSLGVLNAVAPKDDNTLEVVTGISYGSHRRQQLDIYLPKDVDELAPVTMFLYGGSWINGKRQDYAFVGHAFNTKGYITVLPDYRLVPEIRYPEFLIDNANALRWVYGRIEQYGGDQNRIFVVGHSAGAYNGVMLGLADALFSAHDLDLPVISGFAGLAGPYDFLPLAFDSTKDAFGEVFDLPSTQPVNLVSSSAPPMILITGTDDKLVLPKHSFSLHDSATSKGAESTLVTYQDVGHIALLLSLSKSFRSNTTALEDVVNFFQGIQAVNEPET